MTKVFGTPFTGKEIVAGFTGAVTIGLGTITYTSQNKANKVNNNLAKLQARSTIRRDLHDGHITQKEAVEYCQQQEISSADCLNPTACPVERKPFRVGRRPFSLRLRGGGSDEAIDTNSDSAVIGDVSHFECMESQVEPEETLRAYHRQQVKNEAFIGVDPNVPYSHTSNESRITPFLPYIFSGAFLLGYFVFQWYRKQDNWVKTFFPNETELIIENQIKMQYKLDEIHIIQEKMHKKLLNEEN